MSENSNSGTTKVTVHLPWHSPFATPQAAEDSIQRLNRQGKISAELETAIRQNQPITAARRREIEVGMDRAPADKEWLMRRERGGQVENSQYAEWIGWIGRRVEG
jgi:hypothetical protein